MNTAWKVSKYTVFSGPYFLAFGLITERYGVSLRIQSECWKIRTRINCVSGYFSRSERYSSHEGQSLWIFFRFISFCHIDKCFSNLHLFSDQQIFISNREISSNNFQSWQKLFQPTVLCRKNAREMHVLLTLSRAGLPYLMMTCLYKRQDTKCIEMYSKFE